VTAEFSVNNKMYLATNMSPFMTNYSRELRIAERKGKVEKATELAERIKKV